MKLIDKELLDNVTEKAKKSDRKRMNYNFHSDLQDPVNRLLNAIEPTSYIRPHRHSNPDKVEIFLVLRGKIALFLFDDEGVIIDKKIISPENNTYGGEIEAGVWHSLISLEEGTVIYEIKHGPFAPLSEENLAKWSPEANNTEEARRYMDFLAAQI